MEKYLLSLNKKRIPISRFRTNNTHLLKVRLTEIISYYNFNQSNVYSFAGCYQSFW